MANEIKAVCGGFYVGDGLHFEKKTLSLGDDDTLKCLRMTGVQNHYIYDNDTLYAYTTITGTPLTNCAFFSMVEHDTTAKTAKFCFRYSSYGSQPYHSGALLGYPGWDASQELTDATASSVKENTTDYTDSIGYVVGKQNVNVGDIYYVRPRMVLLNTNEIIYGDTYKIVLTADNSYTAERIVGNYSYKKPCLVAAQCFYDASCLNSTDSVNPLPICNTFKKTGIAALNHDNERFEVTKDEAEKNYLYIEYFFNDGYAVRRFYGGVPKYN